MSEPFLTFIIPVRDDASRLAQCLATIKAGTVPAPFEIIVVDNGSKDDSALVAQRAGAKVLSLPSARVSEARNAAAARATAPLLGFVDADHLLDPGWLDAAHAIFADSTITGAGAPCASPPGANWVQRAYGGLRPVIHGQTPTSWLGSGNLIVRRAAFEQVRGFDAALESCEDVDLCNRLVASGARLVADERLRNMHVGDPRTLRALFFGELWRGRDNLRVTLRGPLTVGALPSLIIPIVQLGCMLALLASPWLGGTVGLIAVATFAGGSLLRALRALGRQPVRGPVAFLHNLVVALVYDAARACALVFRATHRTRREVAGERAVA